ncbi:MULTISPECIES: TonB-dependent receptor [unclassified Janthinobacterium]|uniref:TonB-dependent receptor n=1 Tax=unclassified Janthinobacterium TaxID=2610881 RepID=UPI001607910A|nr:MULTISPECIES: TonB-dependent receptor [unclassified Janthinobacterium]MBB5370902.1 iron complex outermembrane receptor protein [Janthinobacterium sp. K2C7]MBB5383708.1 iron complex outermembrane receptor protein [Janthinobacterium sp. K2Li3]MBB5388213.1 iron complex outermembrane receptor protein [Janthinobacterium sp. K2E3]
MMVENVISRSLRLMFAGSLVLGMQTAYAQETSDNTMQRVEVTGSSIKRLASETALPITSIKADDFVKQGLTTAQEVLSTISMNQSSQSSSQSVGSGTGGQSVADLRGIGSDKTLVLLNGRRIASHPFNGSSVDLNIIPISALERVEVLRDGASAIYGTDAIGGVINFITKRSVKGGSVSVEHYQPQKAGGGDESRLNLSGGYGDLNQDGFNVFGVVDVHRQSALSAADRAFSASGYIPGKGVDNLSGTTFPANFYDTGNGLVGNPAFASGCVGPNLYKNTAGKNTCAMDVTPFIDAIPKTQQESFLGKASFKLNQDHLATIEYLHSRSTNQAHISPPPMSNIGLLMPSSSPYYPGGSGGVPAVPGLSGQDLDISWRPVASGQRSGYDTSTSDRLVLALEGVLGAWDYNAGLSYSVSKATSAFTGGYLNDQRIIDGIANGILNPFGAQSAAGEAYLQDSVLKGEYLSAKMTSTALDAKISRELFNLPAGAVGFAVGTEFRNEKAEYNVNRELASQASSSGYADALGQSGSRNISALFSELSIPVVKDVELSLAARYDHYNDVGGSFNPKVGLRWQPTNQVLLRSSYNTGFRAPTLYDLHGPQTKTFTANKYNDPRLCPNGVAIPGANDNVACRAQQYIRSGGNPEVKPEKSKTFSAGIVLEPIKSLTMSLDYFNIKLRDKIGTVAEQTLFDNYAKYKDSFVYSADGTRLEYVLATLDNLGEMHTAGLDLGLNWKLPRSQYGNFTFNFDGTWVQKYEYQNERDGEYVQNVGVYGDNAPVFRWRHNASLQWNLNKWSTTLSNKYMSGYRDQNYVDPEFEQSVKAYSVWSLSGAYSGFKNTEVTVGVKNLLNQDPPFSNQIGTFQTGYDPRFTDPLGRTFYVRATYKF